MSLTRKRKEQLLILLLALLALSISANYIPNHMPAARVVSVPKPVSRGDNSQDELPSLDRLNEKPATFSRVERNIFQFGEEDSAVQSSDKTNPDSVDVPSVKTAPAEPSMPDIQYLGYYREIGTSKVRMASISNGNRIYVAKQDDVLTQSFKLLQVTKDYIVIRMLDDNRVFRIAIGKNKVPVEMKKDQG